MKRVCLEKKGNTPLYLVVAAIMIGAVVLMGIAFAANVKGSVYRSFNNQNTGFDYYIDNIAEDPIQ